jgi:hypothetical protein
MLALVRRTCVQARYVVLGCAALLLLFQLVIVGQASAIEEQKSFSRMTELVPGFLQRGLGSKAMLLVTFKGTVAFGYFHPIIVVLVGLLAAYFATEPAHEVESGLVDLELARSVPRHALITRSLVAALSIDLLAMLVMALGTWLGLRAFAAPDFDAPSAEVRLRLLLHLAAVTAVFAALGLAIAAGARRWSTAFFTTALIVIGTYLIDFLAIGWPLMRSIAWLSPFRYYPALSIVAGDAPAWSNLAILLAASAAIAAFAYVRFARRDV